MKPLLTFKLIRQYQKEVEAKTDYTSVWLLENKSKVIPQKYHCPICRCPLFEFTGDLIAIIPGGSPTALPVMVKCKNKYCNRKYYIHGIVYRE